MSPTPLCPTRQRPDVPASIFFSPRELKRYRRWQNLHTTLTPAEQGLVPTAYEYDDFRQWLHKQDSGYFSDTFEDIADHIKPKQTDTSNLSSHLPLASLCKHLMHPVAAGQVWDRCPLCTIDIHLTYMKALTGSLQDAVGRPLPGTGTPSKCQEALYEAWLQGKIATLRQLDDLEAMAVEEEEWSARHDTAHYGDINTAGAALDLYWFETSGFYLHNMSKKKNKTVHYTQDTNFLPGRQPELFSRRSPRYQPGKHTIQEAVFKGVCDISDDSEDYSQDPVIAFDGFQDQTNHSQSGVCTDSSLLGSSLVAWDDGDSDWEDIDSDGDDDDKSSTDGSYVCLEEDEGADFVVFTNN